MNPLSGWTYCRRHKRSTVLLISLVCLATMGLYLMVSVLDSIPMRAQFTYLTAVSRVHPAAGRSLEPGVASQIQTHPDVARVVPDNGLYISPPTLIGVDSLRLMGVSPEDAQYLMVHCGVRLKEGRMFEPRANEIVLSEEVARALGLEVGDEIARAVDDSYYSSVSAPLVLVGVLKGDPAVSAGPSLRLGFASYEYLAGHESYAPRPVSLLVVPQEGRKGSVDDFLETVIASGRTETETYGEVSRLVTMARQGLYLIFGVVNCVVAVVVALVVGVINRIALTQRVRELGLLYAVGYRKRRLIGRLTAETAAVAGVGWGMGLGLALLILAGLRGSLYYARGMELDLRNLAPFWFVVPIPVVVVAFAVFSARQMFARLDAVAIIERGKLSLEAEGSRGMTHRPSTKPLSAFAFYRRHRRRGVMLVVSMALMIVAVSFPVFLLSSSFAAMRPGHEHLRYVSEVSAGIGDAVDPAVATQIRDNSAVARVIQTVPLSLQVLVPPGGATGVSIYGVSEDDLPALMDILKTELVEGRLPRPRSNEIVIPRASALNRGLRVGDGIGRPLQGRDGADNPLIVDDVPTEMAIVGLLSRDDLWVGFASLEYLQSHELTAARPIRLLLVPAEGRKGEMDAWLEGSVASAQTRVENYDRQEREFRQVMRLMLALFAGVESIIAVVAAIALAALNYIFFAQRREEFGILHAVGRGRPWLVFRTVKETGSVVGIAWLVGAAVCAAGLIGTQIIVYAPRGLSLDFTNLAPWLFTSPIPLAVIVVGAGTIARTLRRLDPVSVIEMR